MGLDQARFYGLTLLTAPGRVMTPRPASERLAATALQIIGERPARVVDVGTGSGALAIAIASAAPQALLWATDNSCDAVVTARANVQRHGLTNRITVRHGDLLEPVPDGVDLVVANLPPTCRRRRPLASRTSHTSRSTPSSHTATASSPTGGCSRPAPADYGATAPHRRVFTATRDELPRLLAEIEAVHRSATFPPQPHLLAEAA